MTFEIIEGDCLQELPKLPENSFDLCATDGPYGISFMGKHWDIDVPSVEIWSQVLRVLKDGSFLFAMSSPRQDVLSENISRIRKSGFDTNFTSLYWTYASGFPKAMNVSKAVDKRNGTYVRGEPLPTTRNSGPSPSGCYGEGVQKKYDFEAQSEQAKDLDGSYAGFQPKPAIEIIIVAMKPLSEKTYVDQAVKNGKGITWLDNTRIPFTDNNDIDETRDKNRHGDFGSGPRSNQIYGKDLRSRGEEQGNYDATGGRFPANLLVSDDILNDGRKGISSTHYSYQLKKSPYEGGWKSMEDLGSTIDSSASFSRYFSLNAWWQERISKLPESMRKTFPFLIEPKASSGERNEGLGDIEREIGHNRFDKCATCGGYVLQNQNRPSACKCKTPTRENNKVKGNHHPSVKPIQLMSYLITLGSRENDLVLDPFMGSGTTGISARLLARNFIGIEIDHEYCEIARARLKPLLEQHLLET